MDGSRRKQLKACSMNSDRRLGEQMMGELSMGLFKFHDLPEARPCQDPGNGGRPDSRRVVWMYTAGMYMAGMWNVWSPLWDICGGGALRQTLPRPLTLEY